MDAVNRKPRILITRLSALGDCILTLPLVCALRDRFPEASLAWTMEPLAASLLRNHRALDHVIVVPKGWLKSPATIRRLRAQLRALQVECVVDPQSLTKSAMLGWLSGARRRIGFTRPLGRELAPWLNTELVPRDHPHIVDAMLNLLTPLGIVDPPIRFDVPSQREAESEMERFLQDAHLGRGFAAINSGASWNSKRWMPKRFGRVARHLGEHHELPSVVTWAGKREVVWARRIVECSGGHAIMAPETSLPELAALLGRASMAIASDTGPLHLAAALGTPCIGLYGLTRCEHSGPYGAGHIALQVECQVPQGRRRRREDRSAMRVISVDTVCQACDDLLARADAVAPAASASSSHAA